MVRVVRSLTTAFALSLSATPSSDAYKVRTGAVYEVPEGDRVSPKQLFARDADIVAGGLDYINLRLTLPGRIYIRHVENETAVAAGLFGKLRASGDTRGAVEYVAFPESYEFQTQQSDEFSLSNAMFRHNTSKAESLLLDIELYNKNTLKQLKSGGSADVVILEDVVYAAQDGDLIPDGTQLESITPTSDGTTQAGPGRLFVSDPKAKWSGSSLSVITSPGAGGNVVQIDVASLNSTQEELWVYAESNSNVTLFASEFVSPTFMILIPSDDATKARNPLCIATKLDVNLITGGIMKGTNKSSIVPAGSTCVKLPLPPREPAPIRDEIDATSEYLNAAKTATPAPAASTSTSQLVYSMAAAGLLVLSSTLLV